MIWIIFIFSFMIGIIIFFNVETIEKRLTNIGQKIFVILLIVFFIIACVSLILGLSINSKIFSEVHNIQTVQSLDSNSFVIGYQHYKKREWFIVKQLDEDGWKYKRYAVNNIYIVENNIVPYIDYTYILYVPNKWFDINIKEFFKYSPRYILSIPTNYEIVEEPYVRD